MLQSMGSQKVRHDWATELNWTYSIMLSANNEYFIYSPIWIPFISFSPLNPIARTSRTLLNNTYESGNYCLISDLTGNTFSFSPLRMKLAVSVSYIWPLLCWGRFRLCQSSGKFYHKWGLNSVKNFLYIYWDDHVFLFFFFAVLKNCSFISCKV